ncbi:MAG: SIMPL domain-containing protein [Acidobacteriota bacterium]|nr:SIMPL domain-containing protein [Acidobacteriota bacterium]
MRFRLAGPFLFAALLFNSPYTSAQTVEVNRQNRTIEVIVTETVRVEPDVANVTVGCISYGETHDQAYQANLATADKVIKALLGTGLSKAQIESGSLELGENNSVENSDKNPALRKARKFKAHQSWKIRVASGAAQKLIDVAVQAGANGLEDVGWEVADEESLEAKARAAAIEKARKNAGELANSAGAKLGALLYASNMANGTMFALAHQTVQTSTATIEVSASRSSIPTFSLTLFPEKVSKQATVRTVFAID